MTEPIPADYRPMLMRTTLGIIALLLTLTGCGGRSEPGVDGPEPRVSQVALVTATAAGGRVSATPTRLPDRAAVRRYVEQFRSDQLQRDVLAAADRAVVSEGYELAAAVVAVGCEVPKRVLGTVDGDDVRLSAPLPSPTKQCFAPITTVALVLVPAAA